MCGPSKASSHTHHSATTGAPTPTSSATAARLSAAPPKNHVRSNDRLTIQVLAGAGQVLAGAGHRLAVAGPRVGEAGSAVGGMLTTGRR